MMAGPAIEFNRPDVESQLPGYLASLERRAAADSSLVPLLEADRFFLAEEAGDPDQAREEILPRLGDLMTTITRNGPLTDAISAIPSK